jgi:hypothetical protein
MMTQTHTGPILREPTRRLELLTARLQVGCATNCATPAWVASANRRRQLSRPPLVAESDAGQLCR